MPSSVVIETRAAKYTVTDFPNSPIATPEKVRSAEMYKLDIKVDAKESAALERRRIMEQQRQSRIFNARERIMGVGVTL